jgi:hypothetical protein
MLSFPTSSNLLTFCLFSDFRIPTSQFRIPTFLLFHLRAFSPSAFFPPEADQCSAPPLA